MQEQHEGHEVANHTYAHTYAVKSTAKDKFTQDMVAAEQSIMDAGVPRPLLFRPPGDFTMTWSLMLPNKKVIPLYYGPGIRTHGTGLHLG